MLFAVNMLEDFPPARSVAARRPRSLKISLAVSSVRSARLRGWRSSRRWWVSVCPSDINDLSALSIKHGCLETGESYSEVWTRKHEFGSIPWYRCWVADTGPCGFGCSCLKILSIVSAYQHSDFFASKLGSDICKHPAPISSKTCLQLLNCGQEGNLKFGSPFHWHICGVLSFWKLADTFIWEPLR